MEFVKTFQKVYSLKIDSVEYKPDFVIFTDIDNKKNNLIGLETYIGTKNLTEGKHTINILIPIQLSPLKKFHFGTTRSNKKEDIVRKSKFIIKE